MARFAEELKEYELLIIYVIILNLLKRILILFLKFLLTSISRSLPPAHSIGPGCLGSFRERHPQR
jgi:hypothetical protein